MITTLLSIYDLDELYDSNTITMRGMSIACIGRRGPYTF